MPRRQQARKGYHNKPEQTESRNIIHEKDPRSLPFLETQTYLHGIFLIIIISIIIIITIILFKDLLSGRPKCKITQCLKHKHKNSKNHHFQFSLLPGEKQIKLCDTQSPFPSPLPILEGVKVDEVTPPFRNPASLFGTLTLVTTYK